VLAAHRAGIRRILLPSRNEADTDDIPDDVRQELQIVFVSNISEAVNAALEVLVANPPPHVTGAGDSGRGRETEPEPVTVKGYNRD